VLSLRPYQLEAVKATRAAWARGLRSPALVLPPGAGKTVIFSAVTKQHHEAVYAPAPGSRGAGRRTLVVAHRTELIQQAAEKIGDIAPELSVGIVKASQNETRADVVVGSVQTLASADRRAMISDVGLVIVDECHRGAAESYLRVLTHFGVRGDPDEWAQPAPAFGLGVTATMVRTDDRALGSVWQEVVFSIGITDLISAGYLVRPRAERIEVDDLDLSSVRTNRGDFSEGDLGRVITDSSAPEAIAQAIIKYAPQGRGFIFAPTIEAGKAILAAVVDAGQLAAMATGKSTPSERAAVVDDFRAGRIRWLVNCALWTEGTDIPMADTVIIARPTKSRGLYLQMVGRVLRTWPGKTDALVMDVVGVTRDHSLITPIRLYGDESAELAGPKIIGEDEFADGDEPGDLLIDFGPTIEFGHLNFDTRPGVVGALRSQAVDLFAGSSQDWLCTRGGTWFLPAGDRYIALVPGAQPGTFDVTEMHNRQGGTGRWIANGIHDMSYAMAYAEGAVTPSEQMTARRGRAWKLRKPSKEQRDLAIRLGLPVHEGMTSGELGSMITVVFASRRIDPCTARLMGGNGAWPKM
jgi:superfamily II DNA or RNA helicase